MKEKNVSEGSSALLDNGPAMQQRPAKYICIYMYIYRGGRVRVPLPEMAGHRMTTLVVSNPVRNNISEIKVSRISAPFQDDWVWSSSWIHKISDYISCPFSIPALLKDLTWWSDCFLFGRVQASSKRKCIVPFVLGGCPNLRNRKRFEWQSSGIPWVISKVLDLIYQCCHRLLVRPCCHEQLSGLVLKNIEKQCLFQWWKKSNQRSEDDRLRQAPVWHLWSQRRPFWINKNLQLLERQRKTEEVWSFFQIWFNTLPETNSLPPNNGGFQ